MSVVCRTDDDYGSEPVIKSGFDFPFDFRGDLGLNLPRDPYSHSGIVEHTHPFKGLAGQKVIGHDNVNKSGIDECLIESREITFAEYVVEDKGYPGDGASEPLRKTRDLFPCVASRFRPVDVLEFGNQFFHRLVPNGACEDEEAEGKSKHFLVFFIIIDGSNLGFLSLFFYFCKRCYSHEFN